MPKFVRALYVLRSAEKNREKNTLLRSSMYKCFDINVYDLIMVLHQISVPTFYSLQALPFKIKLKPGMKTF